MILAGNDFGKYRRINGIQHVISIPDRSGRQCWAGLLGSARGAASIAGSFLGGWLFDKKSERLILTSGSIFLTFGMVAMVTANTTLAFLGSRILHGFGIGIIMPAYNSLISKVVSEKQRGLAFGFFGTS